MNRPMSNGSRVLGRPLISMGPRLTAAGRRFLLCHASSARAGLSCSRECHGRARGEEQVGAGSETAPRSASFEILPGGNTMVWPPGATTTDPVPALTRDVRAVIMRTRWVAFRAAGVQAAAAGFDLERGRWTRSPGLRAR